MGISQRSLRRRPSSAMSLATFVAAVAVTAAGCAVTPSAPEVTLPAPVGPDSSRVVYESTGDPIGRWGDSTDDGPYIEFAWGGTLGGFDGCNGFGGDWTQTDPSAPIEFHDVTMTIMMCEGVDGQWLTSGRSAVVHGDELRVIDVDGAVLGTLPRT